METIVITGANRGIGLRLTESYVQDGHRVFAACRSPEKATDLTKLADQSGGKITVHPLDVCNATQREALQQMLGNTPVDVLINNAGVYPHKGLSFGQLDAESWLKAMEVNAIAPFMLAQTLLPNVVASNRRLIANVTSKMGSISDNNSGGSYAYRATKSALNSAMHSLAIDLHDRGISVILLHPGWVQTDMGGPNGLVSTDESVQKLRRTLDQAGPEQSGNFIDLDGSAIPW